MFLETSALNGTGVQEVFLKCARSILTKIEEGSFSIFNEEIAIQFTNFLFIKVNYIWMLQDQEFNMETQEPRKN